MTSIRVNIVLIQSWFAPRQHHTAENTKERLRRNVSFWHHWLTTSLSDTHKHTPLWSDRVISDNAPLWITTPINWYTSKIMSIHSYLNSPSPLSKPVMLLLTHPGASVQLRHSEHTHSATHSSRSPAAGIKTDTCHQSAGPCAHCCPLRILIAHCNYVVPLVILRMQRWAAGYT